MTKDQENINWSGETVLIADDDHYNHLLLEKVIMQTNAVVLHAYTGKEAEEILKAKKVTIAILDIVMPQISGLQVLKNVKQLLPGTIFIAYTADIIRHTVQVCEDSGFDACYAKPTLPIRLITGIDKCRVAQAKNTL